MKVKREEVEAERYATLATKYVLVRDIALHLGCEQSNLARQARRKGICIVLVREPTSGKNALAVTADDAKKILAYQTPRVNLVKPEEI